MRCCTASKPIADQCHRIQNPSSTTHNHAPGTTLLYEVLVGNPYEVEFVIIDSIVEKLRAKAKDTPADFVVLSEDPHAVDSSKIKDIEVVRTVVGGAASYRA